MAILSITEGKSCVCSYSCEYTLHPKSSGKASAGKLFQQIVREFLVTSKRDPGRPNLEVAKNVKISHRHILPHLCKETFSLCTELTILMTGVTTSVTTELPGWMSAEGEDGHEDDGVCETPAEGLAYSHPSRKHASQNSYRKIIQQWLPCTPGVFALGQHGVESKWLPPLTVPLPLFILHFQHT